MKLAAIDVGSNAARLQISKVTLGQDGQERFKKLEYIRYPLRLGKDVFSEGKISPKRRANFVKLMRAFALVIDLHEVDEVIAYATSATREAENGEEIAKEIRLMTGLPLEVIDGEREARVTFEALSEFIDDGAYIHIDVGGGSTELNLHQGGEKIAGKSFPVGSVRSLAEKDDDVWTDMRRWINDFVPTGEEVLAVGTGGNINKLSQLIDGSRDGYLIDLFRLEDKRQELAEFTTEERMSVFNLNPDRADVIVPASEIYLNAMRSAGADKILVPRVGLKDGMLRYLYKKKRNVPEMA
ncbi:exopolyphosphatase [Fulvitalea axinellae]|uniref:Exopolyphosphatase n=1 Tax=Fulvitalea axinellae TaxID=1182444 RepID=A0AAU9DD93_9BACT|nr:exopolyphosphatase [Fulvitalea axinellae]